MQNNTLYKITCLVLLGLWFLLFMRFIDAHAELVELGSQLNEYKEHCDQRFIIPNPSI